MDGLLWVTSEYETYVVNSELFPLRSSVHYMVRIALRLSRWSSLRCTTDSGGCFFSTPTHSNKLSQAFRHIHMSSLGTSNHGPSFPSAFQLRYTCNAPSTLCTSPKNSVMMKTRMATQKVYHCTELRRSFHHCRRPRGLDSSNACFRMTSRSCQKRKCSKRRFCARRLPHRARLGSRSCCAIWDRSQRRERRSFCGKRSERVRRVSSMKVSGKRGFVKLWVGFCYAFLFGG